MKLILLLFVFSMAFTVCKGDNKLIIDNDAGGDDALAIFIAIENNKHYGGPKLVALTTANGNTDEENVTMNNQKILKIANAQNIPIYRGSKKSIIFTPEIEYYYGYDGLGDSNDTYTDLAPAKEDLSAVAALIEYSKKYEGELIVVTLGPVTNVALAISIDPNFLNRLHQLYIAAGHKHNAESPNAEFNAASDAEAYHIIAENAKPDKVTMLPFSQVMQYLNISMDWRLNVFGAIDTDIIRAQNKFERVSLRKKTIWDALDPAAVAVIMKPDLVSRYIYMKNGIYLCGDQRGRNTNEETSIENANIRMIWSMKVEKYKQFLLDLFSRK